MKGKSNTPGFTLIEMLLALTLTAVLLTIVSVTLGSVLRDNQRLEVMRAEPLWLDSAAQIIRRDLVQAGSYRVSGKTFILKSNTDSGGNGDSQPHDPVLVEYELLEQEDTRWLVRRVKPDGNATTNTLIPYELIGGGVESFNLLPQISKDENGPRSNRPVANANRADTEMLPIPDQMLLSISLLPPKQTVTQKATPVSAVRDNVEPQVQLIERVIVIR